MAKMGYGKIWQRTRWNLQVFFTEARIILLHIGLVTFNFHFPDITSVCILMFFRIGGNVLDPPQIHYS